MDEDQSERTTVPGLPLAEHHKQPLKTEGSQVALKEQKDGGEDAIADFFNDTDKLHVTQKTTFNVILAGAITLWVAYIALLSVPSTGLWLGKPENFRYSAIITSVVGAALAGAVSVIVVVFINRANLRRIDVVKNLAKKDIVLSLLRILDRYDRKYAENKQVYLKFEKVIDAKDGFQAVLCSLTISQRVKPNGRFVTLAFQTLNDSVNGSRSEASLVGTIGHYDLYSVDTTTITRHFGDRPDLFKGVTSVVINTRSQPLPREKLEQFGNYQKRVFDVGQELLSRDTVDLTYTYSFCLEMQGYTFFEAGEPTHGFLCEVDYRAIAGTAECRHIETFHSTTYRHDVAKSDGVITVSSSDWVFPRSSAVFCWFPKDNIPTNCPGVGGATTSEQTSAGPER